MNARHAALVALAAAVILASAASAGNHAVKHGVSITANGTANATSFAKFVLEPLEPGAIKPDSGTESSVIANRSYVTRDGQYADVLTWLTTCKGKRGSFVLRVRIEHIDAGNDFHIGTGTWTFVRGTGAYAGITGGGRVANAYLNRGLRPLSERRDGFLTLP
jgi:hypothetical protein